MCLSPIRGSALPRCIQEDGKRERGAADSQDKPKVIYVHSILRLGWISTNPVLIHVAVIVTPPSESTSPR
jgi:hypothetical protein